MNCNGAMSWHLKSFFHLNAMDLNEKMRETETRGSMEENTIPSTSQVGDTYCISVI